MHGPLPPSLAKLAPPRDRTALALGLVTRALVAAVGLVAGLVLATLAALATGLLNLC